MPRKRVLVPYPADVIAEIDKIVAPGKRTAFLVELAKREIKRRRTEDHPEIDDAGEWVRRMRAKTCLDVAREIGVIGVAEDLPAELSTNPEYFEGFGKD